MKHRSILTYPWDIVSDDQGRIDEFCKWAVQSNLTAITVATSYHAGKFIRPSANTGPRVIFPEDGMVYFKADLSAYGAIKPKVSTFTNEHDVLATLCDRTDLQVYGWTVLLHNTRLGYEHIDCVVHNAFGDPYPYSLCPSNPDVRRYAISLCADLSNNYKMDGLSIETPGFLPFAHGFHHEFSQMQSNVWLNHMLGLCFCDGCVQGATETGVDAARLKKTIADKVDAYLKSSDDLSPDQAQELLETDLIQLDGLAGHIKYRCDTVTSLVGEIKAAMRDDCQLFVIPTTDRPTKTCWVEGSDLAALANVADGLEIPFYEPTVARVLSDAADVRSIAGDDARIRGILRPGQPDFGNPDDLVEASLGLKDTNVEGVSYYNYGLLRPKHRHAISTATNKLIKEIS